MLYKNHLLLICHPLHDQGGAEIPDQFPAEHEIVHLGFCLQLAHSCTVHPAKKLNCFF